MLLKPHQTIVFFGDSITERHKTKTEGAPADDQLGHGFVNLIHSYFLIHYPAYNLRIINQGISGQRAIDLVNRFDSDVLNYHPDWMFLMIGTNDAWRQMDSPQLPQFKQTDDDYKLHVETLIQRAIDQNINVFLCSPFMIDLDKKDKLRQIVDRYVSITEELASRYQLPFVNTQKAFDRLLRRANPYTLSKDRIHPNTAGHLLIAEEIIKTIEKG
jgi:lysophospholipase L1-like esterase